LAFTTPLLDLVLSSPKSLGETLGIRADFLQTTPIQWADSHMALRYQVSPPNKDEGPDHPARLCHAYLQEEYRDLRSCIMSDGSFSTLLLGRIYATQQKRPVGNGIGWDFTSGGDVEPRMLSFKLALITSRRSVDGLPKTDVGWSGHAMIGGACKTLRAGLQMRAAIEQWPNVNEKRNGQSIQVSGGELSRRWIVFQTYNFLISCGIDAGLAWSMSRAPEVFGAIDRPALVL
jgi:hypothetical protein